MHLEGFQDVLVIVTYGLVIFSVFGMNCYAKRLESGSSLLALS